MTLREIPFTEIENMKTGCAQDIEHATGCTVLLCERGAPTGLDVRGGGPAARESALLCPTAAAQEIHAVLLSGGSAYGLDAAGGVMRWLEERGTGLNTGFALVPLVCQSCLYDLELVSAAVRPDGAMGRAACEDALRNDPREGNFGAGTGAAVGKPCGTARMMKSGQGFYALQLGELRVGALVAVNALGDVYDPDTGEKLAGLLDEPLTGFASSEEALYADYASKANFFTGNTTIGAVVTNGRFDKTQMTKVAQMAHNGYARTIRPVNTTADGDSVYAMSVGEVDADVNVVGTLAALVMARAVARAVRAAAPAYGLKAARDFIARSARQTAGDI